MKTKCFDDFAESLQQVRQKAATADALLLRLLLAHTVTLMEVYLHDIVQGLISKDQGLMLKLAESKYFQSHKITLATAIKSDTKLQLQALVKEINFHSLGDVEPLFRQAFNIKITITPLLVDLIKQRNDIAHRNGRDKLGLPLVLTTDAVTQAADSILSLVQKVDEQAVLAYGHFING